MASIIFPYNKINRVAGFYINSAGAMHSIERGSSYDYLIDAPVSSLSYEQRLRNLGKSFIYLKLGTSDYYINPDFISAITFSKTNLNGVDTETAHVYILGASTMPLTDDIRDPVTIAALRGYFNTGSIPIQPEYHTNDFIRIPANSVSPNDIWVLKDSIEVLGIDTAKDILTINKTFTVENYSKQGYKLFDEIDFVQAGDPNLERWLRLDAIDNIVFTGTYPNYTTAMCELGGIEYGINDPAELKKLMDLL